LEESGLRGRTCYWLAKYGKEKHYQMGTKTINIGLKTQNSKPIHTTKSNNFQWWKMKKRTYNGVVATRRGECARPIFRFTHHGDEE